MWWWQYQAIGVLCSWRDGYTSNNGWHHDKTKLKTSARKLKLGLGHGRECFVVSITKPWFQSNRKYVGKAEGMYVRLPSNVVFK